MIPLSVLQHLLHTDKLMLVAMLWSHSYRLRLPANTGFGLPVWATGNGLWALSTFDIISHISSHQFIYSSSLEEMVASLRCLTHGRRVLCFFLAAITFSGAFFSGLQNVRNNFEVVDVSNLKFLMLEPSRSKSSFSLNAKKRKDNRKYVISSKDGEDEPDDDYFEDLAEDVKVLLRSSKQDSKPMTSSTSSINLAINDESTISTASDGGVRSDDTVSRDIK
jgi:hypothetical protein